MLSPHKPQDTKQNHDQQGKADECDSGAVRGYTPGLLPGW